MDPRDYQHDLSLHSPILLDHGYKRPKVEKMLAILRDAGAVSERRAGVAVDIGCSRGFFTEPLVPHFEQVFGVDIDRHALGIAVGENPDTGVAYVAGDSLRLPFADASVDLVTCNHVYEHVPDARALFAEIHRVLKDSGMCYLGAASRLIVMEPHYHLPFLSWLPRPLAHRYMRLTGRGDHYYEKLRTYWALKALLKDFKVLDYTLRVLEEPDRFAARDVVPEHGWIARVPHGVWKACYWLLPTYLLILRKKG